MRFRHPNGDLVHLAYCSNVHPADTLDGVLRQLDTYTGPLRERLDLDKLGVGLWLARPVLDEPDAADRLRERLDRHGLEVVTLNGFPYKGFHDPVVKLNVYRPDWADPDRSEYLIGLARILARLLPDDVDTGSISTLPIGWRTGWSEEKLATAVAQLQYVDAAMAALARETGKRIEIALEPEPGCLLETTEQLIELLDGLDLEFIGGCPDACHMACQFESADVSLAALHAVGIPIPKAQISSALQVDEPRSQAGTALLGDFVEPRFMHQVRELADGEVQACDDLPVALDAGLPGEHPWRVHFHVPVHAAEHSTQAHLIKTLETLVGGEAPLTRHLEVETYTWSVLPDHRDDNPAALVEGLAAELEWTAARLRGHGLEQVR